MLKLHTKGNNSDYINLSFCEHSLVVNTATHYLVTINKSIFYKPYTATYILKNICYNIYNQVFILTNSLFKGNFIIKGQNLYCGLSKHLYISIPYYSLSPLKAKHTLKALR
jgi:hypothetical protein